MHLAVRRASALVVAGLALTAGSAGAQQQGNVAPPSSPIERSAPRSQPEVTPPLTEPGAPPPPAEAGPPVTVLDVDVTGVTVYKPAEVDALFAPFRGQTVPSTTIDDAVRQLQLKYRDDGYFLTKVAASTEAAEGGVHLHVHAVEGYIASVKLSGDVGPVETLIYAYLQKLEALRPVRIADIERYVLLVHNIPGISIRTVLRGMKDEPGAVEMVAVVERKKVDASVADDNRSSRTTGPNELVASVALNSFTSLGEQTQFVLYDTPVDDEQLFGQLSTEVALGDDGLRARAYVGYGNSVPGDILRIAGYRSRLLTAGGDVRYPVIRTRSLSLFIDQALDVERSEIDLLRNAETGEYGRLSNSHLVIARTDLELDVQDALLGTDRLAANSFDLKFHKGIGPQGDSVYPARPEEDDAFTKYTAEAKRTQQLFSWTASSLDVLFAVSGQWSPNILPPSEKFFLGGESYGRGFFSGEVTGDRAIAGTTELQFNDRIALPLFQDPFEIGMQYYGFYDVGQTWDRGLGAMPHHIESTGCGVRSDVTSHLSIEVEGVERFTRRPIGDDSVSLLPEHALYFRIVGRL